MDVLAFETYWAKVKQVTSVGLSLFNYQGDARSNKHKIHMEDYSGEFRPTYVSFTAIKFWKNNMYFLL